jgi:hypothetical protein
MLRPADMGQEIERRGEQISLDGVPEDRRRGIRRFVVVQLPQRIGRNAPGPG